MDFLALSLNTLFLLKCIKKLRKIPYMGICNNHALRDPQNHLKKVKLANLLLGGASLKQRSHEPL